MVDDMVIHPRILLSALWVSLMLTYLLGDVLRIFSGDFADADKSMMPGGQAAWLGISALMLIPILMVVLSLALPYPVVRWVCIVAAAFFFLFNAVGLPTYPSAYDKFLIIVGLVFNLITIWVAWSWVA